MNRIRDRDVRVWPVAIALLAVGCAARGGDIEAVDPAAPEFMSRASWSAEEPILPMSGHGIDRITIHHTAFLQEPDQTSPRRC